MVYKSPPVGNEISCVMYGVKEEILNNHEHLKEIFLEALKQENFTILNQFSHEFEPKGFTMIIMLAESHATLHTYPEYNSLHFSIYSCRGPEDGKKVFEFLKEKLSPSSIDFSEKRVIVDVRHGNHKNT
ncbi:MAG TPA: adenosylmethionine decarboxylase [Candidatus Pacearchaeota archaeon]|nr:S-adenosylmethionine decarboxylase proenzyme precursor [archaeon BMS3Abin17]HDK41753.1 adenosylmethionine decarboxylase [Candidatus Pacearchaeota archaeon]HDZ60608.1 adenosylmethionine decarboxylase [Candidatus Pacearchaeota archaeon]